MSRVSRRLAATIVAATTVLILTTSAVSAADPDSLRPSIALGARSHVSDHGRLQLQHGGGLKPPATDVEAAVLTASPVSGAGSVQMGWVFVFVAGALVSLRYLTRRARL